jgi:hypothetical protein
MESRNSFDGLDPRAVATVRHHASRLARSRSLPGMDLEDVEQDLALDLLHRGRRFDPARASFATFADRVVGNRVATLTAPGLRLRAERAMASLDKPVDGEDQETNRGELMAEQDGLHARRSLDRHDELDLRHDVARFLRGLTPALRRCAGIIVADNVAAAAKAAGLHRGTVYEGAHRLRVAAARSGLDIYVRGTPTESEGGR